MLDPVERTPSPERKWKPPNANGCGFAQMAEADRLRAFAGIAERAAPDPGSCITGASNLSVSIELLGRARKLRPDSIEINVLFNSFNDRHRPQRLGKRAEKSMGRAAERPLPRAQQQQPRPGTGTRKKLRLAAAQAAVARLRRGRPFRAAVAAQQAFLQLQVQAQLRRAAAAVQSGHSALSVRPGDPSDGLTRSSSAR